MPATAAHQRLAVSAIAASAALSPVASAQSITQLNAFGGGGISVAKGVSNDGSVIAGYAQLFGGAYSGAAIWASSTDPQQPAGASAGGGWSAEAVGVSADGSVVAGSRIQSAFRWTQSGGSQFISNLSGGSFTSARSISGNGSVIVGVGDTNAGPFTQTWQRAFRWNSDGSTQQLGSLHPYDHSYANAVNFDGSVIVGESASQAFRWTADGGMVGLGFLSGTSSSKALAVSVDGSVVVGRSGSSAFRWTAASGMQVLGSIWSGAYEANAVSADGSLVVGWHGSSYTAMVWDAAGEAIMLSQYLRDRGVDLSGWPALYNAYGMSGDGRFIVGWGSYQGQNRAFVADVGVDADVDGVTDTLDNCPGVANPTQDDCNSDGVGDACEIADGAADFNGNHIPDSCECPADLFADGRVNGADLGVLLSQWGPASANTVSDINRDSRVDGADLGFLLNAWGPCPN